MRSSHILLFPILIPQFYPANPQLIIFKLKPFLLEIAEQTVKQHASFDRFIFVFPNRRAILYFRKYLSSLIHKPAFSPRLLTIEDFIAGKSSLQVPDKLELIYRLYQVYYQVAYPTADSHDIEPFDQFYFWGDMLLRDFDEADKYMVDAGHLFKDLSHQKELDSSFDFLTEQQREFLKDFWGTFDDELSPNKKKFLKVWKQLPEVYSHFKQHLYEHGLCYEGMLLRDIAEKARKGEVSFQESDQKEPTIRFVGFNALTIAEEVIITELIQNGIATAYWDVDAYYLNNSVQEAGLFLRKYQQHTVLGKTFPSDVPSHFLKKRHTTISAGSGPQNDNPTASIKVYSATQSIGQAKLMAQVLNQVLAQGASPEETLIVLPDEKLLIPVLHGIASGAEKFNVTMGFPLASTPLFNLVELLIELQINLKDKHFNHRQVLAVLSHPYVVAADPGASHAKSKEILLHNWVHIPESFLATSHPLHRMIFSEIIIQSGTPSEVIAYLKGTVHAIGILPSVSEVDKEYIFYFIKLFTRMEEVLYPSMGEKSLQNGKEEKRKKILKSFVRLFRQMVRSQRIPFSGEPLKGLQIMGVLETRNLDFKNVFVLSLNEGVFPSFGNKGSYIPYNIRRAYNLPTVQHQDAIYSYLFYRMLQRAENIFLFYNSETDVLGQGEMSRYLNQLLLEGAAAGLSIEKYTLHNPLQPQLPEPIVVKKDMYVFNQLAKFCEGSVENKYLSPSTLNDYIDCPLKFYLRHVARIREPREVEEDLDARILGNFLHKVMELFYVGLIQQKGGDMINGEDFSGYEKKVNALIDKIFIDTYRLNPDKPVEYEGQRLIVREVVKRFADEIVKKDKIYAPFQMLALERRDMIYKLPLHADGRPVAILGGSVDRADYKDRLVRVVDYKTGKDRLEFESIESLFRHDQKRNKAAFQTLMYALLFYQNHLAFFKDAQTRLLPGLFNRINLFDEDFKFGLKVGSNQVEDAIPLLEEFQHHLKILLEELFSPDSPFTQTTNLEACNTCPYHRICYR